MLTIETRQRDFPSLAERVYLNTSAEGIPPLPVIDALAQYGHDKLLGMDGRALHEAQWHATRQEVATLFGLTAEEVGICSCSSEAFNLAALALQLTDGDEVVINDLDFPAGATPWLLPDCRATVRLWKSRDGALRTEDLIPLLSPRTRLVSTSLVSFYNGFRVPLAEIIPAVRQHSPALVAVDVTQALGRIALDLHDIDLIISSTHKWLLASHGGGLVGVPKSRAAEWTVPAGGWFNLQNAFDANRFERATVKPGAASFSVGMPSYAAIYCIAAASKYINSISVPNIAAQADPLVRQCLDELKRLPVTLLTPADPQTQSGIISFLHPQAEQIHRQLHSQNIHVMHHAGRLRVALHGYNTAADVERFLEALKQVLNNVS